MGTVDNNYLLVILGIVAIVVEIIIGAATGFDLLIIGVIFILSGGAGVVTANFSVALVSIVILSFLYIFIGRQFIRNKLSIATKKTNTDNLLGMKGVVTKEITSQKAGQVKVDGEVWRAVAHKKIEVGTTIIVNSVSGITLDVDNVK